MATFNQVLDLAAEARGLQRELDNLRAEKQTHQDELARLNPLIDDKQAALAAKKVELKAAAASLA